MKTRIKPSSSRSDTLLFVWLHVSVISIYSSHPQVLFLFIAVSLITYHTSLIVNTQWHSRNWTSLRIRSTYMKRMVKYGNRNFTSSGQRAEVLWSLSSWTVLPDVEPIPILECQVQCEMGDSTVAHHSRSPDAPGRKGCSWWVPVSSISSRTAHRTQEQGMLIIKSEIKHSTCERDPATDSRCGHPISVAYERKGWWWLKQELAVPRFLVDKRGEYSWSSLGCCSPGTSPWVLCA